MTVTLGPCATTPDARTRNAAWRQPIASASVLLLTLFAGSAVASAPSFEQVHASWQPSEAYLLDRHGVRLHELRIDSRGRRLAWTPLEEVSPALIQAIVQAEDRRFYEHPGVDWRAVAAAVWSRLSRAHPRGASTLSMQLAAMLDRDATGRPGRRSAWEKFAQMRAALALEQTWRKDQILEAYLNLAGFRGELQGIRACARGLFGKEPAGLDEAEALLLAAMLPSPNSDSARLIRRACALAVAGSFEVPRHNIQDLAEQLVKHPHVEPSAALAPHVAQQLLHKPGETVRTTLDASLQRLAAEALTQQLHSLIDRNVRDGAVIVADNASGDILAYVGSGGPYSKSPQVDGVRAARQAGSTLKPFLYALAFERRYLTAASLLNDSPVNLETANGLYIPQNYDRDFKGMVSVRTALAGSLNVPAVRALSLVGVERFRDRLVDLGYAHIQRDGDYYGFSLALGSAEVSLLEQVNAFRTLANQGRSDALRLRPDAEALPGRRIIDEPTAYVIADILADRASRAITFGLDNPLTTRFWTAVKTGTSKDMRDNWCIGFSRRYTVGVWVGNFEGDSMQGISGITGAAPVWLAIMEGLHGNDPSFGSAPPPPAGLMHETVDFSPAIEPPRTEWFLAGTENRQVVLNDPTHRTPQIVSPPDGVLIALDPDIPLPHQAVIIVVAAPPPGAIVKLDGDLLGPAAAHYQWTPVTGQHRLMLIGEHGKVFDSVDFSVRQIHTSVTTGLPHQP